MSGEAKTLTLDQAVDLAQKYLEKYLDADNWHYELVEKWPEELEADYRLLLEGGVPVVARDEANDDLTTAYLAGLEKGRDAARAEAAELRAENAQLRADLREYVEDGFLQGAHRQEDGGYSTGGISTYRDLGDWLVEHAGWTRREGGVGRMQVYDPPRRLAGGESEEEQP